MRKLRSILAVLIASALLLAGCGDANYTEATEPGDAVRYYFDAIADADHDRALGFMQFGSPHWAETRDCVNRVIKFRDGLRVKVDSVTRWDADEFRIDGKLFTVLGDFVLSWMVRENPSGIWKIVPVNPGGCAGG